MAEGLAGPDPRLTGLASWLPPWCVLMYIYVYMGVLMYSSGHRSRTLGFPIMMVPGCPMHPPAHPHLASACRKWSIMSVSQFRAFPASAMADTVRP